MNPGLPGQELKKKNTYFIGHIIVVSLFSLKAVIYTTFKLFTPPYSSSLLYKELNLCHFFSMATQC